MQWEHMGKAIEVTQGGEFQVSESGERFGTLEEARKAIEDEARLKDVNLAVLYDAGQAGVVSKVHRGTGRWLLKDASGKPVWYWQRVFFPCPTSESLLAHMRELKEELADLEKQLTPYVIPLPSRYTYAPTHTASTPPGTAHEMHQEALKAYEELRRRFAGGE